MLFLNIQSHGRKLQMLKYSTLAFDGWTIVKYPVYGEKNYNDGATDGERRLVKVVIY